MKLSEIAKRFGIEEYPEEFQGIFESMTFPHPVLTREYLLDVEERLGAFGAHHIDEVVAEAERICLDEGAMIWVSVLSKYMETASAVEARATGKVLPADYQSISEMIPLFPIAAMIPRMEAFYRAHGFEGEELRFNFRVFEISLRLSKIAVKKPAFTRTYYSWTLLYTLGEIFDYASFNFQYKKFGSNVILLRNKKSGEYLLFPTEGIMHRDGRTLGDAGYTDEEGSFDCALVETDDEYIGYPAVNNVISNKKITVKKADYDVVLTKEDYVIGLHIPRNVDFSDEAIEASLRGAVPIIRERFPEWQPKMYVCSTWLNDPGLEALLGSESRIVKFGKRFLRYPGGAANGRGGYGFVFLGYEENENLPEDTSLRRKLKAHYLNGGYTYFTPGIICDESYFGK